MSRRPFSRLSCLIGALVLLAAGTAALGGCGQSGPLYLPQKSKPGPAKQAPAAGTARAPAGATR